MQIEIPEEEKQWEIYEVMINVGFTKLMKNIILTFQNTSSKRVDKTVFIPRYICVKLWNPKRDLTSNLLKNNAWNEGIIPSSYNEKKRQILLSESQVIIAIVSHKSFE